MLNRPTPFFIVAKLLFSGTYRFLGISNNIVTLFQGIYNFIPSIVTFLGIIPAMRIVWTLRYVILGTKTIETLNIYGSNIEQELIKFLKENWVQILSYRLGFIRFNKAVLLSLLLYSIRPLFYLGLRGCLTLILSSLGIFWIETLRGFKWLLNYAFSVKNFFSPIIEIPIPKELRTSYFKIIGGIIFSTFSFALTFIGLDFKIPDAIRNLPGAQRLIDGAYTVVNWLIPLHAKIKYLINKFRGGSNGGGGILGE